MAQQTGNWWVTGASSGIGLALALRLAERGHRVWISARSSAALRQLAQLHSGLVPLPCDVTDDAAMAELFAAALEPPPWLDGAILCAGTCEYVDPPALDAAAFQRVFAVNLFGVVNASRAALPLLHATAKRRPGNKPQLAGVGSLASTVGFPRAEAYGASKAALSYFFDSLRCDVQQDIDVTVIHPGFVTTPMTASNDFPMPFVWTAEQAADYILARLGARPRRISFPWQLRSLLGLAAALPAVWYRLVVPRLTRAGRSSSAGAGS
jgi:NAD(P)-dependent dehydrogenase (short-subunit alcohol dehydrogenase family)